ncbi:hypothetical protein ABE65_005885 [Fictibacillus phosphorivorans]|uniref:Aminopeptidase n=1 Tax=Fictibacillus phosphorivorans TaxID=1221500 RepID=A0A160IJR1_9BACL|nr:hypothetical protein [Fictibacillus phosphorivorans]ANC76358.1 hypothetical protein ABE65_005885 [Fictibacillus phosphorivorans]
MKIIDTVSFFLKNYQPTISFLKEYYKRYPSVFHEYFSYHCKDTQERHDLSIKRYQDSWSSIQCVHDSINPLIQEVVQKYEEEYGVQFPVEVNLIVGGYGSNAYTHRQIIPNVTFALEKLSPEREHLKTIVAHEFGHATQNILTDKAGMKWERVNWNSPMTWLNQEGAATHFSRRIVGSLHPSVYFSFDNHGCEWLEFAQKHEDEILLAFAKDYNSFSAQSIFSEWFSINGGKKFGHSRLGYYIADLFFQNQVKKLGEGDAITAWNDDNFIRNAESWLSQKTGLNKNSMELL